MITLTRTIRHQARLRFWLAQHWSPRRRRAQAQDASTEWFTLQAENDDGSTRRVLASTVKVADAGQPGCGRAQTTEGNSESKLSRIMRGLGTRRLALTAMVAALIAALAVAVIAVQGRHPDHQRQALTVQQAEISRLTAERDQALTAVRQARTGEMVYRAQAARWRSRALARKQPRAQGSRRVRRELRLR